MFSLENRLRVITLCLICFALVLVGKLYFLQVVQGSEFRTKAEHQYVTRYNYFDRGSIYFSTKDGSLVPGATVKDGFLLSLNPSITRLMPDLEDIYSKLNSITPLDKTTFFAKAKKENDTYEELSKHLDAKVGQAIQALKITGVRADRERWRTYPGQSMASHTLGLVGYGSGNTLTGQYGLERFYENTLKRDKDSTFSNFFVEIFSNLQSVVSDSSAVQGDLVTTIEPSVQAFLERELSQVTNKYSSEFTGGVVIDPNTGEIVAMALTPSFDPNSPQNAPNASVFRDRLVEDRYEMGSIIKSLTYAIGLETKSITPQMTYNDPGCMTLDKKTFCNYDQKSHGSGVTMQTALGQSLNTGAALVAQRVGTKRFNEMLLNFGLEEKTGIDLPNEGASLTSNLHTNRDLEAAQASFGQGVALTPIATVRALSSLANGGTLITPHLVKEIKFKIGGGKTISYPKPEERKRVLSEEASGEISKMLVEVVDKSLRNGTVSLPNYSVAAKTGTAQIANPGGRGYYEDRYLHSFFGYFPAYNSRFLVFLFTYYPKNVQFASETLTDSFFNITKFLINYYEIPPDRERVTAKGI